jgi:hypothetical protein
MTVIRRAAEHTAMPWANGRGVSHEIARSEDEPGRWRWRLAIAPITEDGPFSSLPGVQRALTLIEGHGLVLTIDGNMVACTPGEVVRFAGWSHTHAALTSGPVVDLNLMFRDESPMSMSLVHGPCDVDAVCVVAINECDVVVHGTRSVLQPRDAIVDVDAPVRIASGTAAVVTPTR